MSLFSREPTTVQVFKKGMAGLVGGVAIASAVVETLTLCVEYFKNKGDSHKTDRKAYKKRRKAAKRKAKKRRDKARKRAKKS